MAKAKEISLEPLAENKVKLEIVGDSDLILHSMSRHCRNTLVWQYTHPKGSDLPAIYKQDTNRWEGLITSIHWKYPIVFHDENIALYTEDEWKGYMENNVPCILSMAFLKSFKETFITFYRETVKKAGTDFARSVNVSGETQELCPISFSEVRIMEDVVPTRSDGKGSTVYCGCNVFSGWRTEVELSCPKIVFPLEMLVQIVSTTGKYIGIGTQRANGFGRYHIESATVING